MNGFKWALAHLTADLSLIMAPTNWAMKTESLEHLVNFIQQTNKRIDKKIQAV